MTETLQLKNVLITAAAMSSALADFASLNAGVAFRDGDDYAVLDDSVRLGVALASPEDHPAPGELVLTAKAEHVGAAAAEMVATGAELVTPPHRGAHEFRALIRTTGGLLVLIYGAEE